MNVNSIRPVATPSASAPQNEPGEAVDFETRVHKTVLEYFTNHKRKGLVDPPYADAFHRGVLQLQLKQPQAGDSPESNKLLEIENRRTVYDFVKTFSAGTDKAIYKKLIEKAIVLMRSRELLAEGAGAGGQTESATLKKALTATFTSMYGINFLSTQEFFRAAMLGDEKFEIDDEW